MGTRNLTLIQVGGEYKVAQYGQWDGNPRGLGVRLLWALRAADLAKLQERVSALEAEPEEGNDDVAWTEYLALKDRIETAHCVEEAIAKLRKLPIHRFSRDCGGAGLVRMLMDKELTFNTVGIATSFAADSLFCEWAYVVDFDKRTLEVYEGFNKETLPADARFKFLEQDDSEYKPVKLRKSYSLDSLPSDDDFLNELEPKNSPAPEAVS